MAGIRVKTGDAPWGKTFQGELPYGGRGGCNLFSCDPGRKHILYRTRPPACEQKADPSETLVAAVCEALSKRLHARSEALFKMH